MLCAYLLGPPRVEAGDPPTPVDLATHKGAAVLYYLASRPDEPVARTHLVALLWQDSEEQAGRNSLSTALSRLRRALPNAPIVAAGDALIWRAEAGVWTDIYTFRHLARPGANRSDGDAAVALWRGPFLEGFDLRDCPEWDDWLSLERAAWQQVVLDALERAGEADARPEVARTRLALARCARHQGPCSTAPAARPSPTHSQYASTIVLDHPAFGSDEALLLRVGAADGCALADLYERHAGTARALANRMLYDHDEAEDVVQDVFLTLWHRPHHFDPDRGSGRAWLLTVVRNRSRDHLRRRILRQDVAERAEQLPDPDLVDTLEELDAASRRDLLWRLVGRLPPEQAALIQRAYVDGQTHKEISAATGLPLGTVKSRIRLGLEKLRVAIRRDLSS